MFSGVEMVNMGLVLDLIVVSLEKFSCFCYCRRCGCTRSFGVWVLDY